MTQQEINKAFEGRWRIKGFDSYEVRQLSGRDVKALCQDFFETAVTLATPTPPTPPTNPITPTDFDTWWQLYDKKVGRTTCEKKWNKLTTRERQDCMTATPAYVASTPDKQFRKNPLTYLNQKAWNDEIIYRNNESSLQQQRLSKLADILAG